MTAEGTDEPQSTAKRRRFTWRHALGVGVAIAVVVATFVFILPKIADYRDVWGVVKGLSWKDIALLVGATILNLVTFAPPWMAALPGLRFRQALIVTQASTALVVRRCRRRRGRRGDGLVAMLRRLGFRPRRIIGLAIALTGLWNQLSMLAFPILALVLLASPAGAARGLGPVGRHRSRGAGRGRQLVRGIRRCARRQPRRARARSCDLASRGSSWASRLSGENRVGWVTVWRPLPGQAIAAARRRWHVLTAATVAGHFTVFLVLLVACGRRRLQAQVSTSRPSPPGRSSACSTRCRSRRAGSASSSSVSRRRSSALGGQQVAVVAAVLVYRFLTIVPTLVIGLLAGVTWKRYRPEELPTESPPAASAPPPGASL